MNDYYLILILSKLNYGIGFSEISKCSKFGQFVLFNDSTFVMLLLATSKIISVSIFKKARFYKL